MIYPYHMIIMVMRRKIRAIAKTSMFEGCG
jgi:hypothetical protein